MIIMMTVMFTLYGCNSGGRDTSPPSSPGDEDTPTGDRTAVLSLITGNRYYVDATSGNDETGNGQADNPYQSLEKVKSLIVPGDGVFLRNGNYGEYIETTTGRDGWVVFINDEGHTPVIRHVVSRFTPARDIYLAFYGITFLPEWVDPQGDAQWQATHPGSTDPQYPDSETGTYAKTADPLNLLGSNHISLSHCEIIGTNKHLTPNAMNIDTCSHIRVNQCHIHRIRAGITYQSSSNITLSNNYIHNTTSTFFRSGGDNTAVLIEGNHAHDCNWSLSEDWCPRAIGHTYHASFVSIRSSNVTIRNNIFHDGGTSSMIMTYLSNGEESYHHILIENNLIYDPLNQTGLRLYRLGSDVVIRNNILVGRWRDEAAPGARQYGQVFQLGSVAEGYDGSGLSVYNNIFVGTASFGEWFDAVDQFNNICWSALKIDNGIQILMEEADLDSNSRVITSGTDAPDYFTQGFFNGEPDFSWTDDPPTCHGHGLTLDYTYTSNSEAINFGHSQNQPEDSLGTLGDDGFILNDGPQRDANHHSAGCYEF